MKNSKQKEVASAALQILDSLAISGPEVVKGGTFLEFTHKWTDIINRGGLVKVNDNMLFSSEE